MPICQLIISHSHPPTVDGPQISMFQRSSANIHIINIDWLVVIINHLETYEFVNGKDDIRYIMENKNMFETTNQLNFGGEGLKGPVFDRKGWVIFRRGRQGLSHPQNLGFWALKMR